MYSTSDHKPIKQFGGSNPPKKVSTAQKDPFSKLDPILSEKIKFEKNKEIMNDHTIQGRKQSEKQPYIKKFKMPSENLN